PVRLEVLEEIAERARADDDLDVVAPEERTNASDLKVPRERRERADAQHATREMTLAQRADELVAHREDRVRVIERDATRFRQDELTAPSLEELVPEIVFELLDLHGHGGLRDPKASGGAGEVSLVRHRPEIA